WPPFGSSGADPARPSSRTGQHRASPTAWEGRGVTQAGHRPDDKTQQTDIRPIRWGVIATGGIAHAVTTDLTAMDDAEVGAVGSRALERAEAFTTQYAIPRAYGSYDEVIADADVDVVYVATPHAQHHEVVRAA